MICIPVLKMPFWLRKILSIPQGILYTKIKSTISISDLEKNIDVCVGDYVSNTLGCREKVFDGKTMRRDYLSYTSNRSYDVIVYNPRGTISLNSKTMISLGDIGRNIYVVGEEDLIPFVYVYRREALSIVYGQPGVGVVVSEYNYVVKNRVIKMLKTFKPDIVCIKERIEYT